jgi:hypothetical protein
LKRKAVDIKSSQDIPAFLKNAVSELINKNIQEDK